MAFREQTVPPVDKRQVRASFERAASSYDAAANFQRDVGARLIGHLDGVSVDPRTVLDLGAGTGAFIAPLQKRYPKSRIIALDIAVAMLARARARSRRLFSRHAFVCGDAERLPLRADLVDLLFSNLTLQWCIDLPATYAGFARVLTPGGAMLFSTLGPGTLAELRASWSEADGYSHVNTFTDMHDVGDALIQAGLVDVVIDADRITRYYDNVFALMRDLKSLGAHNVTAGRGRGLTTRSRVDAMVKAYERYRLPDGRLPASYEVVYAHGKKPAAARGVAVGLGPGPTR